jgi:hypothetical protein
LDSQKCSFGTLSLRSFQLCTQVTALALGAQSDFTALSLSFDVMSLPRIKFERCGPIVDVLNLVDPVSGIDGAAHGVTADERKTVLCQSS